MTETLYYKINPVVQYHYVETLRDFGRAATHVKTINYLREVAFSEGFGNHATDFDDDFANIIADFSETKYSSDFSMRIRRFSSIIAQNFVEDKEFLKLIEEFDWNDKKSIINLTHKAQNIIDDHLAQDRHYGFVERHVQFDFFDKNKNKKGERGWRGYYSLDLTAQHKDGNLIFDETIGLNIGVDAKKEMGLTGLLAVLIHENIHAIEAMTAKLYETFYLPELEYDAALKSIGNIGYPPKKLRDTCFGLYQNHPSEVIAVLGEEAFKSEFRGLRYPALRGSLIIHPPF